MSRTIINLDDVAGELEDVYEFRFADRLTVTAPAFISALALRDMRRDFQRMKDAHPVEAIDIAIDLIGRLVGAGQAEAIARLVDGKRLVDVVLQIFKVYGLGEASGSSTPSNGTGASSKPTSPASTPSTSDEPASPATPTVSTPAGSPA